MKRALSLLPFALLAACTAGPDYHEPPRVASDAAARGRFVRAADPSLTAAPGLARWWEGLDDTTLTRLIDDALAHNPSLDLAQDRIREAIAVLRQQRASRLPNVSASASYIHAGLPGVTLESESGSGNQGQQDGSGDSSDGSTNLDFYNLGATASWEIDLFGGGRRAVERARATVGQRFADLADAQVSLTAQVAQAYVNLRATQERLRLDGQSSVLQHRALDLTRKRVAAGAASQLDVERLQNQLESTDAQLAPLRADAEAYLDQLAVLTGREPGALDGELSAAAPIPLPPPTVPVGDPASLIAHRPDIRSAERALAAGTAGIGVNKAKMFPSLRFMGILGIGGTDPGDVLDPGKLTTLLMPSLNWSFLDFGRNAAAVRQAEAQRDQAADQYRKTVLEALRDAESSLSRFGHLREQLGGLARSEAAAARSAALNDKRVQAGASATIDQLDIERQRLAAAAALAQGKAQLTNAYIGVQKSLGLGWTDTK